ncbi:MAG: diguanylate cyclase [Cyanobacteria bacterium J06597_16]
MFIREHPDVVILYLTAILSSCVALTAWTRRALAPATRPFTSLLIAIAAYAITAAVGSSFLTLRPSIFWATLEYVASNSVIALYLTFTLHFSELGPWLNHWRRRSLIWALPIFNMGLVATNHWHSLVWSDFVLPTSRSGAIDFHHGALYFWIAACFYSYVITGTLLVARVALNASSLYRKQAFTIMLSALPPILAGTLYVLDLVPPTLNVLPMSFAVTGIVYFASLFYCRLFDLLPIARDVLIERMSDGVLVLDGDGRVIDMNSVAGRYTHQAGSLIGQPLAQVMRDWPDIISHCRSEDKFIKVLIVRPHLPCHLEITVTRLYNRQQRSIGRLLVIRNITEQQQNQLQIEQSNTELKRQLKEIQTLRDQLKEQAIRDGLTRLFNRRYFEETLPAEIDKANRAQQPLSIMLLDIDYFKKVNDTYGHLAGDQALRMFASIIQKHIRSSDIACRYGGEEFVVAMPNMTQKEACQRANNIRLAFKKTVITFEEHRFQATVSIGLGSLPQVTNHPNQLSQNQLNQNQLLEKIDQALYSAKANGRDRVETVPTTPVIRSKQSQLEEAIRQYQRQLNAPA